MMAAEQEGCSVKQTSVVRLARVLKVLVLLALVCNVVLLYLIPVAVLSGGGNLLEACQGYLSGLFFPGEDDIVLAGVAASLLSWVWVWMAGGYQAVLAGFLIVFGSCTAVILWQARRVLDTILAGTPFSPVNAVSMKRAAVCCLLISLAALGRTVWRIGWYGSFRALLTYNALFVPVFAMAFLLCMVMSALFRQAAELKAENDLTI